MEVYLEHFKCSNNRIKLNTVQFHGCGTAQGNLFIRIFRWQFGNKNTKLHCSSVLYFYEAVKCQIYQQIWSLYPQTFGGLDENNKIKYLCNFTILFFCDQNIIVIIKTIPYYKVWFGTIKLRQISVLTIVDVPTSTD